jgi:hypothetical protein
MKNLFSYPEYLQESQKGTLYSDDNPKDTIKDLRYGTGKESEESVQKLESLYKQKKSPTREQFLLRTLCTIEQSFTLIRMPESRQEKKFGRNI